MFVTNARSLGYYTHNNEERQAAMGFESDVALPQRGVIWDGDSPAPGSRRGMISNAPHECEEGSYHYHVLSKQAKQKFRVSERFCSVLFAWWGPRPPIDTQLALTYRELGRNKGKTMAVDTFYDYRGRVYQMSGNYGSLQNSRLSRAAIEATEAVSVRGTGAWEYALEVFEHEGWATTPEAATEFLSKPSTDWMAIRAAICVLEVAETGCTAYLLEQDATCSGFQHVALLTRDRALAEAVNATITSTRGDLYATLAAETGIAVELGITDRQARSMMKPIVMLTGYGSGAGGIASRIWQDHDGPMMLNLDEELVPDDKSTITLHGHEFNIEELTNWVKPMQKALFEKFPIIKACRNACMAYMQECIQADPSVFCWVTPNGFQAHRQILPSEQAAEAVSDAGAMPNLIHSLDGCVVQYTIEQWDGVLGVVHDAFFTTIDRAEELRDCVRAAYGRVYDNLGEFPVTWAGETLPIGLCVGV